MASDLAALIVDPQFQKMGGADQRSVLTRATGDQSFASLSDADTQQFVSRASDRVRMTRPDLTGPPAKIPSPLPKLSAQVQTMDSRNDEPAFGHIQTTLGNMANDTAKNLWQISAPGIATSFANQHPNVAKYLPFAMRRDAAPVKELPGQITMTALPWMVGGLDEPPPTPAARAVPKPAAASAAAAAPEESGLLSRLTNVAKRRISHIPGVQAVKDIDYVVRGSGGPEAPPAPAPKPPAPPVPETNGVPWGTGGQGPVDLRGKMIPQASAPEPTPQPAPSSPPARTPVPRAAISRAVDDSLGVQPIQPGVPLRQQLPFLKQSAAPETPPQSFRPATDLAEQLKGQAAVQPSQTFSPATNLMEELKNSPEALPEGHTPVESQKIRSYKYDPQAQELHVQYRTGDTVYAYKGVTPDQAQYFTDAIANKQSAGQALRGIEAANPYDKISQGQRTQVRSSGTPLKQQLAKQAK